MYHKWRSYDVWLLIYQVRKTYFVIFGYFLPFYPPNNPQNQNLEKMKKTTRDITILYMSIIKKSYVWFLRYGAWQTEFFFSFWTIFCPFTPPPLTTQSTATDRYFVILGHCLPFYPPNSPKNENKKMKKHPGDIIILQMCTKNHDHRLYCSWDMARDRCNYFSVWAIFCPFTS